MTILTKNADKKDLSRKERNEILKNNFSKIVATLNPFGTIKGRAFRIGFDEEVAEYLNIEIKKLQKAGTFNSSTAKSIYQVLNQSDTRDFLTVYSQELLKDKGKKAVDNKYLLSAIKMASLASIYPVQHVAARQKLSKSICEIETLALDMAKKHSPAFAKKLQAAFDKDTKPTQDIMDAKVDVVRIHYWNKFETVSAVIGEEIARIVKDSEEIANSFVLLAKYQSLFNESKSFVNSKRSDTIMKNNEYADVSREMSNYFKAFDLVLTEQKISFRPTFLTHITESSEKIYLSDMPRLSPMGFVSLFVTYLLLMAWSAVILFPLVQMIQYSFDGTRTNRMGESSGKDLGAFIHYKRLFQNTEFLSWLGNSLEVAFITMALTVVLTVLLAYAFSRFKFKGKKSSLMTVMLLQMVPSIAALTAFLVLYQMLHEGIKIDVLTFLIVIYTGGAVTGNTFVLKGYFDSIPRTLDEAAELDGASKMRTFRSILIPLAKPMIAIVALWSFIGPFGDVILPNLLNDGTSDAVKKLTMAAGLRTLVASTSTGGSVFQLEYLAGAIITSIPIAAMFIGAQKFLVGGLTAGAVK